MIRITGRTNDEIKRVFRLLSDKGFRKSEGVFVCEGFSMLSEAVKSGAQIEKIFCLEGEENRIPPSAAGERYLLGQSALEKISDVRAPQGVVFTCRIPEKAPLECGRIIAVENLRDPGNMGTVIRSAEAFGISSLALLGECADIWSPKVIRATMGSVFRQRIVQTSLDAILALGLPTYAAALVPNAKSITQVDLKQACVIIGNEARGVSDEILARCGALIIPISGAESLNAAVAASVVMWEMSR